MKETATTPYRGNVACNAKKELFTKMKILFLILTIFISETLFSQGIEIKGTWLDNDNNLISIRDTSDDYYLNIISTNFNDYETYLVIKDKVLSFQKRYFIVTNIEEYKYKVECYNLKILKRTDSTLVIKTINKNSRQFFEKKKLHLTKQEYFIDNSIQLEKIIIYLSECYRCPKYKIEINRNNDVKLYRKYRNKDSSEKESGFFTGKLSDSEFHNLENLIQSCNLKTLNTDFSLMGEFSMRLFIKTKTEEIELAYSMPPAILENLIDFIEIICEKNDYTTSDKLTIGNDSLW
ncbi:DUF6438 domain-containing protein [Saccharicrinis sp. FJH62]|uniref:DUF6438 domain-containing protein n=1 Tax=Saccharicrinis sp. FJH62 TaxID=3344657 RepID=UPI0035D436DD